MDTPEVDVVLIEATSAAQARSGAEQLAQDHDTSPFIAVVSADIGSDAREVLDSLRPGLQEILCFDSLSEPVVDGQDFAMRALEELGFGQDFVFTVPVLEQAVDYAVDKLRRPDRGGWEGRFVVVLGSPAVLDRAREHLRG